MASQPITAQRPRARGRSRARRRRHAMIAEGHSGAGGSACDPQAYQLKRAPQRLSGCVASRAMRDCDGPAGRRFDADDTAVTAPLASSSACEWKKTRELVVVMMRSAVSGEPRGYLPLTSTRAPRHPWLPQAASVTCFVRGPWNQRPPTRYRKTPENHPNARAARAAVEGNGRLNLQAASGAAGHWDQQKVDRSCAAACADQDAHRADAIGKLVDEDANATIQPTPEPAWKASPIANAIAGYECRRQGAKQSSLRCVERASGRARACRLCVTCSRGRSKKTHAAGKQHW